MVCYAFYLGESTSAGLSDRRPVVICKNGHSLCMMCAKQLQENNDVAVCPSCREGLLNPPIINRALLEAVEMFESRVNNVPEIPLADLTVSSKPFASGAFSDAYFAKWHTQNVVLKALRLAPGLANQTKLMSIEANLASGLHHPNIIRMFGTATMNDGRFAIVMEKAEHGSLQSHMKTMKNQLAIKICLGVVDGLDYVHSRRIAHRDLKPDNILLCEPSMTPKIGDFGVSKVMQTLIMNSSMVGTPKYAAPELLNPGSAYGFSVDIFSLTVILYELFSKCPAEAGLGSNAMQIMLSIVQGRRPTIPPEFPTTLKPLIARGWSPNPRERPALVEFRTVFQAMAPPLVLKETESADTQKVSIVQQSAEVSKDAFPLPMISLKWNTSCEILNSLVLRKQMVENMKTKSNMSKIINASVLCAFEAIPRHLFVYPQRLLLSKENQQQEIVNQSYVYNKPIPATTNSNESSPEIIGTQLSLTQIIPGQAVLLVGIKGGYIQSLVAQLVGIHGLVVTATSDTAALEICRNRVNGHCPFKSIINWVSVDNVKNPQSIAAAMKRDKLLFHTVIYCGSTDHFPEELYSILHPIGNVSVMAPVKEVNSKNYHFQLSVRQNDSMQMKTITDFGVIFECVH
jgi:serine/threonine protein kinase